MDAKTESMLTTYDNPYDPFTDWDRWYRFDTAHHYHTSALLARIAVTSEDLSDRDQDLALDQAIDEIVYENVSGMHRKVIREVPIE